MSSSGAAWRTGGVPLGQREIDVTLERLRGDRDRISASLLELDNHVGHQLLKGAELSGDTERLWEETQARMTSLWRVYDAYDRVLEEATRLRGQGKLRDQQLTDISRLLTGPCVEIQLERAPLAERKLLGPTEEKLTLDGAVARMTRDFDEAADRIAKADAAWSALLPTMDEADRAWREAAQLVEGDNSEQMRLGEELIEVRRGILADPLGFDRRRLDRIATDVAAHKKVLEDSLRIRDEYGLRVEKIKDLVEEIKSAENEALEKRQAVLEKIANPGLPDLSSRTPGILERLHALSPLKGQGRWTELAREVNDLERVAAGTLDTVRAAVHSIQGLLDRREELRGRLGAYKAKAGRMGYAEDPELNRLYSRARDLLWTASCDLRQATMALATYQRAIGGRK